jgi:hypothetical protein
VRPSPPTCRSPPIKRPGLLVVPPNCSAVLERSAPMIEPESGQALVTPPAVWPRASPISRRECQVLRPIPASRGADRGSHGPSDAFPVGTDCGTCLTGFTPAPGISRGPREPRVAEASQACAPPLTSTTLLNLTWARGRHPGQVSWSFHAPGLIQPNTLCTYDEPSLCRRSVASGSSQGQKS